MAFCKSKNCLSVMCKRMLICKTLGIVFGLLCVSLAASGGGEVWGTALMLTILFNRLLIGVVVALAGFISIHPVFQFRIYPWLRGFLVGALVSLYIAIGMFIAPSGLPNIWTIFWMTILVGGIYGMIIDVVATKFSAEGEDLFKEK